MTAHPKRKCSCLNPVHGSKAQLYTYKYTTSHAKEEDAWQSFFR
jgi:hypothetical protein